MTLAEIIKKIIEAQAEGAEKFDGEKALNEFVAEAMEGLQKKNSELLGKLKTAKEVADGLPEDFSVEKWNDMVKALEGVDLSKMQTPEQVEAVKENLTKAHATEVEKLQTREQSLMKALQTHLVDGVVTSAINAAHGNATLLAPHISQRVKMIEEDGEFRAIVVDDKGTERFSVTKAGERMGIDELVTEFKTKDTFASAFDTGNRGGGAGGGGGKTQKNPFLKGSPEYNLTDQAKLLNTQPEVAAQLQQAAKQAEQGAAA